ASAWRTRSVIDTGPGLSSFMVCLLGTLTGVPRFATTPAAARFPHFRSAKMSLPPLPRVLPARQAFGPARAQTHARLRAGPWSPRVTGCSSSQMLLHPLRDLARRDLRTREIVRRAGLRLQMEEAEPFRAIRDEGAELGGVLRAVHRRITACVRDGRGVDRMR